MLACRLSGNPAWIGTVEYCERATRGGGWVARGVEPVHHNRY
jgi:hypothetical protein